MFAADTSLHPLGQRIPPGDIHFILRGIARSGDAFGVECVYRPYRQWDVKRTRHFNILRGWIGGGSRDLIKTQSEEFHSVLQHLKSNGTNLQFTVSLKDPEPKYAAYQLDSVRVVGGIAGTVEFRRWFAAAPKLDAGFGLNCDATSLRGVLRPSGLGAQPLRGSPPLWPTLRTVDLEFRPVFVPAVQLFEALSKHHWDGWRQTIPEHWPGGRTILLRHTKSSAVWREHEYSPFPRADEPASQPATPPAGVLSGVGLEVYWPDGEPLEFPETRLESDVFILAMPLSKMPSRIAELLAHSVRIRPGLEMASVSTEEWEEMDHLEPDMERPMILEMADLGHDKKGLKITRKTPLTEPWLCIFGGAYDSGKRHRVAAVLLRPQSWSGPLPE